MIQRRHFLIAIFALFCLLPLGFNASAATVADTIYYNGNILTMDDANTRVRAVAVKDGQILATGPVSVLRQYQGTGTAMVNLQGRTMIPGFYDGHSHFVPTGQNYLLKVDLNSTPIGTVTSITDIITLLAARVPSLSEGQWIQGWGYDDTLVAEKRHPTKDDLDQVSTEYPIYIVHISGHVAVANSLALQMAGITRETPDPAGGVIRRDENGDPTGVLEEVSAYTLVSNLIPAFSEQERLDAIAYAARVYAASGVTTANDGATLPAAISDLLTSVGQGILPIRVVMWPYYLLAQAVHNMQLGTNMLTMGGAKVIQDGSIQAYTGYLSKPYYVQPEGADGTYRGYPSFTREQLLAIVKPLHDAGIQVYIHGNGDAAIDDILYAFQEAEKDSTHTVRELRHTVVHSQMAREDQLDLMDELGVFPTFFVLHTYYWGDRHRDIFMGRSRAFRMSPCKSAADRGIRFSTHCDTFVVPQSPILSMWAAVNRISSSGKSIGSAQRVSRLLALRSVTSEPAYNNHEEATKGSIEAGKLADLTILSENPLTCQRLKIKDIKVLKTIVGGNVVYDSGAPL